MSSVELCNLALSLIGNKTITTIENPITTEEKICSLWYITTLKQALIESTPNFARARKNIPLDNYKNLFGFTYAYKKPNDCLKVIGIGEAGNIDASYSIEGEYILSDINIDNTLPIRYIKYIQDDNLFTEGFKQYFIYCLASNIVYQINKDNNLKQYFEQEKERYLLKCNTTDNQESKLSVIYSSRYLHSRFGNPNKRVQK